MSSVGYDLDTSGGLMPLIRALIKPPDEESNNQPKPKKTQHPYYKRPGKGHNHDSCDACGEGGDLICCDRCPASFHLGCYDPPLDENDIPVGLWVCRQCSAIETDKPSSAKGSRAQSPVDKNDGEKKKESRTLRNNRTNSATKKKLKDDKEEETDKKSDDGKEKEKEKEREPTAMEILVKAARVMNPKQFELPREMRIPCLFPGTEKEGSKNGGCTVVTTDAWGHVPLPAKTCFVCSQTCKMAPLLQCDYCPLLFHQDCLDPPLTSLPTGRWMCPNHVEQFIDWKLVNSVSATERVALWDRFSGPVDQHAIKIDFIRRARRPHPPFRVKVPVGVCNRVRVPDMVRHHYAQPPPLPPSRREYVRCNTVLKSLPEDYDDSPQDKHQICVNLSCGQYSGGSCPLSKGDVTKKCPCNTGDGIEAVLSKTSEKDVEEDLEAITGGKSPKSDDEDSSELSDMELEFVTTPLKRRRSSVAQISPPKKGKVEKLELKVDEETEELLNMVDEQLKKLDDRLVKLLAWQRLQQILSGEQASEPWRRARLSRRLEAVAARAAARARLSRDHPRIGRLPSQLLSAAQRRAIARAVWGEGERAAPLAPEPHPPRPPLSDLPLVATIAPIYRATSNGVGETIGRPIPMRMSRLSVGSDSGCDVVLDAVACRTVSRLHANIYYDEVSSQFELINYSEWGSSVDGVLYTSGLPADSGVDEPESEDTVVHTLRRLVAKRRPKHFRGPGALVSRAAAGWCACRTAPAAGAAWEGAALLPHGALLRFGCHQFVFSVLPPDSDDDSGRDD